MAIDLITYEFLKNYVATKTMGDNAIPRGTWNGSVIDYEIGNYVTHNNVVYVYAGIGHENPEPGTAPENGKENPWQEIIGANFNGRNNKKLDNNSQAFGVNNIVGCKGFRIVSIFNAGDRGDDYAHLIYTLNLNDKIEDIGYIIGDKVSIRLNNNYDWCGEIEGFNQNDIDNSVTVKIYDKNNLPDTIYKDSNGNPGNTGDLNSFRIPEKPEIGNIVVCGTAFASGIDGYATGSFSHSEGNETKAIGKYSHAEGNRTVAVYGAHAEGGNTRALGHQSHAEGDGAIASGANSHAEGYKCEARGGNSHAEGSVSIAEGSVSHAAGQSNIAQGWGQSVCGRYNSPNKDSLFIVGNGTGSADTQRSNAFTVETDGSGRFKGNVYSNGKKLATTDEVSAKLERVILDALPTSNIKENIIYMIKNANNTYTEYMRINNAWELIGNTSVDLSQYLLKTDAVGVKIAGGGEKFNSAASASGPDSHAEGQNTQAVGSGSHAEGVSSIANGYAAHAEGHGNVAIGNSAHAEGRGTIAAFDQQHVQGKWNIKDIWNKYAHIIGWGEENSRNNIHTVETNGNAHYAGKVYVQTKYNVENGGIIEAKELATKEYVDSLAFGDIDLDDYAKKTEVKEIRDTLNNYMDTGVIVDSYIGKGRSENNAFSNLGYTPKKIEIYYRNPSDFGDIKIAIILENCEVSFDPMMLQCNWDAGMGVTITAFDQISDDDGRLCFNKLGETYHYVIWR